MTHRLLEDWHVHSTFSDGKHSLEDNVAEAKRRGLRRIGCVDHVRRDTAWVPELVEACRAAESRFGLDIVIGVEAKILDASGLCDVPAELRGVDHIYIADHRLPLEHGCYSPAEVSAKLRDGELTRERVVEALVGATERAMRRYPASVVAHLFSFLPKVRISEEAVSDAQLHRLARAALETDAIFEVDERWRCPGTRTVATLLDAGVPVVLSTDSHRKDDIGVYRYALRLFTELGAARA